MSRKSDMTLTMDSDIFAGFRQDFNHLLEQTVGNMEMKGAEDATITVKFGISLEKKQTRDYLANGYDGMRDIISPTIKHDITSVMQVKEKTSGKFQGDYELVYDRETHCYVFRNVDNGQINMFDDDGRESVTVLTLPSASNDLVEADDGADSIPDAADEDITDDKKTVQPAVQTPFEWLRQFVGVKMQVTEANGIYTVRTMDNRVIVSSGASMDSPLYCPAERLEDHVGHSIVCAGYGDDELVNVSIECDDCHEVLFDIDAPSEDASSEIDVSDDGYEYDAPESELDEE